MNSLQFLSLYRTNTSIRNQIKTPHHFSYFQMSTKIEVDTKGNENPLTHHCWYGLLGEKQAVLP